jgi:hypothetical protein
MDKAATVDDGTAKAMHNNPLRWLSPEVKRKSENHLPMKREEISL